MSGIPSASPFFVTLIVPPARSLYRQSTKHSFVCLSHHKIFKTSPSRSILQKEKREIILPTKCQWRAPPFIIFPTHQSHTQRKCCIVRTTKGTENCKQRRKFLFPFLLIIRSGTSFSPSGVVSSLSPLKPSSSKKDKEFSSLPNNVRHDSTRKSNNTQHFFNIF